MSLLELITLIIAPPISKALLKLWLRDYGIATDISSSLVDILKSKGADIIAQHRGKRQFEEIGERVSESLLPIFESEGAKLDEASRTAVVMAVGKVLSVTSITPDLLVEHNLEPAKLAKHLLDSNPSIVRDFSASEEELYRRVISDATQYIVDISSQLPHFTERSFAEILKRENQLLSIAYKLLDEVRQMRSGSQRVNSAVDATRFETEYRRAVVRKLDELELFGVDASSSTRRHHLSTAYLTLSVEQKPSKARKGPVFRQIKDKPENKAGTEAEARDIMPTDRALSNSRCLLIRGLAGSGKTTLLQWIAVRSASQSFRDGLADWNDTIPFFIRLRECAQSGVPPPEEFPKLIAPAIAALMPEGWVHNKLEMGRAIVLVDGLDEMQESQRPIVRQWLKELVGTYRHSRFIVTSRPSAVEEGWMEREGFDDAELQPMQLSDILSFVEHWHEAVQAVANELHEEERLNLTHVAENISRIIQRNHQIRDLATSPLLCAMICALHRDRRQQIPSDRIELYEACCHMLAERRDIERGIELRDYLRLSYRQKTVLLKDLAYWMLTNGWSIVQLERAEERVTRTISSMPGIPEDTSGTQIMRLFIDRSGLVRTPAPNQVDFTHRTFQEFLAASAALDEGDIGALVKNAHDDQWREVLILAAGLANKKQREDIIRGLIKRGDKERINRHQLHLLAMACLETSVELGTDLKSAIQDRLATLLPPRDISESKAVASAGDVAIPYLAGIKKDQPETIAACVRSLALIGGPAALDALEEYSHDSERVVLDELIRSWDSFDREEYARRVLSNALVRNGIIRIDGIPSLEGIEHLTQLLSLTLTRCFRISNLDPLRGLTNLVEFVLHECDRISDLNGLRELASLEKLCISKCDRISDLGALANLRNLQILELVDCSSISDLSPIAALVNLRYLNLRGCSQLSDLRPLERLTNLTNLILADCRAVSDLGPLKGLSSLAALDLSFCEQVTSLNSLKGLNSLRDITLYTLTSFQEIEIPLEIEEQARILRGSSTLKRGGTWFS